MFWATSSWKALCFIAYLLLEQGPSITLKWSYFQVNFMFQKDISGSKDRLGLLKQFQQSINTCEHCKFTFVLKINSSPKKQLRGWDSAMTVFPFWTKNGKKKKKKLFLIQNASINLTEASKIDVSHRDDRILFYHFIRTNTSKKGNIFHFSFSHPTTFTSKSLKSKSQITHKYFMWLSDSEYL